MKIQSNIYTSLVAIGLLATGCGNAEDTSSKQSTASDSTEVSATVINTVKVKNAQEGNILDKYLALKDALVTTNAESAKVAANELSASLKDVKGFEKILAQSNLISAAATIDAQRKEFTSLSEDMITHFKKVKLSSGKIYVQHCPMANKGDGGDWLSTEKKIQNPYYGSEMMECGAVVDEIGG